MLDEILDDEKFSLLMKMHIYECLDYLLQNNRTFSIMANIDLVSFSPELPDHIKQNFNQPIIIFALAGYTLESAILSEDEIKFEAGFGKENFASVVKFPLGAVVQILVENSPILVNFSIHKEPINKVERSKAAFLSNPNNKNLFKK